MLNSELVKQGRFEFRLYNREKQNTAVLIKLQQSISSFAASGHHTAHTHTQVIHHHRPHEQRQWWVKANYSVD